MILFSTCVDISYFYAIHTVPLIHLFDQSKYSSFDIPYMYAGRSGITANQRRKKEKEQLRLSSHCISN